MLIELTLFVAGLALIIQGGDLWRLYWRGCRSRSVAESLILSERRQKHSMHQSQSG
jgi:hypothetical protein